jgi:hypothetical protein
LTVFLFGTFDGISSFIFPVSGAKGGKWKRDLSALKAKLEDKIVGKMVAKAAFIADVEAKKIAKVQKFFNKGEVFATPTVAVVQHQAPIHIEYHEECRDIPEQHCVDVPREACHVEPEQRCKLIPKESCVNQEKCKNYPKKQCGVNEKEHCLPIPTKKCIIVTRNVCNFVPREECRDVSHEICESLPEKNCAKIVVKRPRQVCVQRSTTKMIGEAW